MKFNTGTTVVVLNSLAEFSYLGTVVGQGRTGHYRLVEDCKGDIKIVPLRWLRKPKLK